MVSAIRYAREYKVPYFGICLGMQTMVIEFAATCADSNTPTDEFDPAAPDLVIYKLARLKESTNSRTMGSAHMSACSQKEAALGKLTETCQLASGTVIATNSTANMRRY